MIFPVSGVLLLPWLNPLASGPSPAVVPLLVSIACAAVLVASPTAHREAETAKAHRG